MGVDHAELVARATLRAGRVEEIDREAMVATLKQCSFARVTGLVSPATMRDCRKRMAEHFDPERDRATTGEHKDEVRSNFQKWSIGRAQHGKVDRPRFMRTFYNPFWDEDIYGMHAAFRAQCTLRNLIGKLPPDFAIDGEEQGVWTAARIHHFPAGGGFMVGHRDTVLPAFYDTIDLSFYQTLLLITEKAEDFRTGGGFLEVEGEHIAYEEHCHAGDIIVYDQNAIHGVDDVDVEVPFRQDSLAGRMSGLVTFYKVL